MNSGSSCCTFFFLCSVTEFCPTLCHPVARQVPQPMKFPRQEYWSGLPFPAPGESSRPRDQTRLLFLLHWQADSLPTKPVGKPRVSSQESLECEQGQQERWSGQDPATVPGSEDGGKGHKLRSACGFQELETEMDSPWSPQKEQSPPDTLILAQETCLRTSTSRTIREGICVVSLQEQ